MAKAADDMDDVERSKVCTRCDLQKELVEFHIQRLGLYGRRSRCILCTAEMDRERHRKVRLENPEKLRDRSNNWRRNNPEKMKKLKRLDYLKRSDAVKAKSVKWSLENPERRRDNQQAWRDRNRLVVRDSQQRARAKLRATAKGHLHLSVGATLRSAIKGGSKSGRRTFELLGFTIEVLMAHLEKQFKPGMTWENYGRHGWHVDHVIPIAAHNFESPDDIDFKRAWALSNLQPLWANENHKKSSKLFAPFQPSLLIGHGNNVQDRRVGGA